MGFRLYLPDVPGGLGMYGPDDVDRIEAATLPGILAGLAAFQARIAARLIAQGAEHDHLLTAEEVADRLRAKVDWVRHAKLPFRVKVADGQVRYSARGLGRYLMAKAGE